MNTNCHSDWHPISTAPLDIEIETKIDDEKWLQSYRCGCFLGFRAKADVPRHCPQHMRDRSGRPINSTPATQVDATWEHAANEWADIATNGVEWLRNVRDGISTFDEAIADMERGFAHCRQVQPAPVTTEQSPAVGGDVAACNCPGGSKPPEAHAHNYPARSQRTPVTQGDAREALHAALNFVSWFTSGNSTQHDPVFVARKLGSKLITEANGLRDKLNAAIAAQAGGE